MTALTSPARAAEFPARFRDLIVSEWIKLWSLRSTYYVLGLGTLGLTVLNVNGAIADYDNWPTYTFAQRAGFSPLQDAFGHSAYLLLMLAAGSVGAVTIVSEYSSGLIRTTFLAFPARRSVVAAKVAVTTVVMLAAGTAIAALSFWLTQAILSGHHAGWPITHPGVLRAAMASALLVPICALVGMGIGALIRHTATTIVAVVVALDLLPAFLSQGQRHPWLADIHNALPLIAWQRLVFTGPDHSPHDPTVAGSWIVYAVWPLISVILAVTVVHRRDV